MIKRIQTQRSDYTLRLQEKYPDPDGNLLVTGLEIKRRRFGSIRFLTEVKLRTILEVDDVVIIEHKKVDLYLDALGCPTPPVGEGLNCPAEITLERIWPGKDDCGNGFESKLKEHLKRQGAEFLSYCDRRGVLKFKVAHFSKYSCDVEEDDEQKHDEDRKSQGNTSKRPAQGGLGGISFEELSKQQAAKKALLEASRPPLGIMNTNRQQESIDGELKLPKSLTSEQAMSRVSFSIPVGRHFGEGDAPSTLSNQETLGSSEDVDEPVSTSTPMGSFCKPQILAPPPFALSGTHYVPTPSSSPAKEGFRTYSPVLKTSGSVQSQLLRKALEMEDRLEFVGDSVFGTTTLPQNRLKPQTAGLAIRKDKLYDETIKEDLKKHIVKSTVDVPRELHPNRITQVGSVAECPSPILEPKEHKTKQDNFATVVSKEEVQFISVRQSGFQNLFSSIMPQRVSTHCKFVGAPRVCFTRNGNFISIENRITPTGFQGQVKVQGFDSYAEKQESFAFSDSYRTTLKRQLMSLLKRGGDVIFNEYADIIKDQLLETNYSSSRANLRSELMIWELCQILWPPEIANGEEMRDHGFHLTQHRMLAKWMVDNAQFLFGKTYDVNDTSVFGLLKKGRREEACEKAMSDGDYWLAGVLVCDPLYLFSCKPDKELCQFFPEHSLDILNLCGGSLKLEELTVENVSSMWSEDWLQYFALYLWYYNPTNNLCVQHAITHFEKMMRKIVHDEEAPLPRYESFSAANLCVHLLKLYSCTGYPVKQLLNPSVWTRDILDHKLSWLLMMNLETIGYIPENDVYSQVCNAFAGQLESIQMFEWAIFVSKKQEPPEPEDDIALEDAVKAKNLLGFKLLEKHIENGDANLAPEIFLTRELNVDESMIWTIKARKAAALQRYDQTMGYYEKAGEYQKAFNVLKEYLDVHGLDVTGSHFDGYFKNLQKHVLKLDTFRHKIGGWEVYGRLLVNYFALSESERQKTDMEHSTMEIAVMGFLNSVIKYAQQAKSKRQFALLMELVMTAQKAIELLLTDKNVERGTKDRVKESLMSFMSIPLPHEYFKGFSTFLNNMIITDLFAL